MSDNLLSERCEKRLPECECYDVNLMVAKVICQNVSDFEAFDRILSNGSVFQVNTSFYITLSGSTVLPKGFLSGLSVTELTVDDFQTQRVEEGAFDGMLGFGSFSVGRSSIKEIPDFRAIRSSLWYLRLANSRLTHLRGDNLKNLTSLYELSFFNNSISHVAEDVFQGTENVEYFDISHNLLTFLPPSLFRSWKLKEVHLSYNKLLHVDHLFVGMNPEVSTPGEFYKMSSLTGLYLKGNRIATLGSKIHALTQLRILSIRNNQIRTITTNQLPPKLTQLFLAGNPFLCDKQMLPFLQFLNSTENLTTDDLCTPSQNGTARCPSPCRCSLTNDSIIFADCSSSGLTNLPPFFTEEQNSTVLEIFLPRANKEVPFAIEAEIEGLDLSNNKIQSLEEARLPSRTRFLFLDHNLIRKLPVSLLESQEFLTRVTLSNNPWTCDCTALDFKKWVVSKQIIVLDMNEARCGPDVPNNPGLAERAIWLLPDRELCPDNTGLYISMSFGVVSFLLAVAGAKIAWTRYQMNVKVWLYSHGVTWVKEKDIDRDKEFDAFISFSYKDQDLVIQELIEVIEEKDPDVSLCLHYKHFLPGEFIQRNIMWAVECSKRTVLVLSRNFLESEWCLLEFNAAHAQALKDQVPRIIVIKLPDLPKDDELPKEIQLYLKNTTYLTWGEKHFWDKLLYILPRSQSVPKPKSPEDTRLLMPITDPSV
ncbi:protein toll [Caerostris darwini]|uniref:Protein toll n=1 Tax=Caerostris darwini TaxID=1538125 RepID=A0AAV4Q7R8_9ARAC|nr:protein toll [Caerostris darwini]